MRRVELALAIRDHDECTDVSARRATRRMTSSVASSAQCTSSITTIVGLHGAHFLEQRQEDRMRLLALVTRKRGMHPPGSPPCRPEDRAAAASRARRRPPTARARPNPASRRIGAPGCSCRCPPRPRRARACRPRRRRRRSSPPALPGTPSARADRPRHPRIRQPNPWRASCDARRAKSSSIGEAGASVRGARRSRGAPPADGTGVSKPVLSRTRAPGGPCSRTGRPGSGTRSRRAS